MPVSRLINPGHDMQQALYRNKQKESPLTKKMNIASCSNRLCKPMPSKSPVRNQEFTMEEPTEETAKELIFQPQSQALLLHSIVEEQVLCKLKETADCRDRKDKSGMYDRVVIKFTGVEADINFNIEDFKRLGSLAKPQIPLSSLLIDRKFNILIFGFVKGRRRKVIDLHRHNIDHITIPSSHGPQFGVFRRIDDVPYGTKLSLGLPLLYF
ncbi:hypothetical protein ACLB2K_077255 [Fragaria x ananassa]